LPERAGLVVGAQPVLIMNGGQDSYPQLAAGRSAPCDDLLLVDENFDSAVASPPARCAVIGNRLARSVGDYTNLHRVDAFLADQVCGDTRGSPLSELVVVVLGAAAVGMPGNNEEPPRRRPGVGRALKVLEKSIDLVLGVLKAADPTANVGP
jgi:hypothetical protein